MARQLRSGKRVAEDYEERLQKLEEDMEDLKNEIKRLKRDHENDQESETSPFQWEDLSQEITPDKFSDWESELSKESRRKELVQLLKKKFYPTKDETCKPKSAGQPGQPKSADKPDESGSADKPDESGSADKPDESGSADKPDESGSADKPDKSGNADEKIDNDQENIEDVEDDDDVNEDDKKDRLLRLLKIVVPNEVAVNFSMQGRKKKKNFSNSNMFSVLEKICINEDMTEYYYSVIDNYLKNSRSRMLRAEAKKDKHQD